MPGKDRGSYAFIKERWLPAHARSHTCRIKMPLLSWKLGAQRDRGEREREKKETKMVLNSFIIQMNENHINASRQGRASVSKLAHQLHEEANEGRGSVWR